MEIIILEKNNVSDDKFDVFERYGYKTVLEHEEFKNELYFRYHPKERGKIFYGHHYFIKGNQKLSFLQEKDNCIEAFSIANNQ